MDDAISNKEKLYIKTSNKNLEIVVAKCNQIDPSKRPNSNDLLNEKLFSEDHFIDYSISNFHYLRKAKNPIEVMDDGIVICVSDEQSLKAQSPIEVSDDGIVI